jgi:predicted N-acetyltransferase YhbS
VSTIADTTSIRRIGPQDSIDEITELLHRAYAALGARGWNYTAVDQTAEVTRSRLAEGVGLVAVEPDGRIVGTITYWPPEKPWDSPWLQRVDVAFLGQFAVEPSRQGAGTGGRLMDAVEDLARAAGARELALDTAEPALHLIASYERRGYRFIEYAQWEGKRYRSVIMSKTL